ncbi:MAG TPA: hypothetical protein VKE26_26675 [Xanthobacteraceae bacterium]|nr:hypothetical protein [Xanthobacteraceae bacterium]
MLGIVGDDDESISEAREQRTRMRQRRAPGNQGAVEVDDEAVLGREPIRCELQMVRHAVIDVLNISTMTHGTIDALRISQCQTCARLK